MGQFHAVFIVVASMLGTGILTTTGFMSARLGGPLDVLAVWVAGAILALLGALSYGAILRRYPQSGGEAVLIHRFYSPSWGYATGLLSFLVAFASSNAAAAMALSAYFWVGATGGNLLNGTQASHKPTAILAILLMTALHTIRHEGGMKIQTLLAVLKLMLLGGVTAFGLAAIDWHTTPLLHTHWQGQAPAGSWALCMLFVVFTYSGWNAAIYAASEFKQPERTVPRAMLIGAGLIITLYLLLNVALVGNLTPESLAGVEAVVALLVSKLFGAHATSVFALMISIVLLSSIGVSAFAGPRVLFGLIEAKHGQAAPQGVQAPARLIWLQGLASIILVLTGSFEEIMALMGVFIGICPVVTVLGMYGRRWQASPPPAWIRFGVAPAYVLLSSLMVIVSIWTNPRSALFVVALIVVALVHAVREKRIVV